MQTANAAVEVVPNIDLRDLPAPEPSAGLDAYRRERELCLDHSADKRANYERYLKSNRRSAKVDYLPIKLDIENVSRCNYRCTMCVVSEWHKGKRGEDMPLDEFCRTIDEQIGLVEIKLQGLGEPTMQGDDFYKMIRYARDRNIWVRTTTNSSLLHLKDNYRKLIDSGVNEIQMSVDGATKEVFEEIRRGSKFELVKKNCQMLHEYAREMDVRVTKMWTVVQQNNVHQLMDFVPLAEELGFRDQAFAFSLTDWGSENWRSKNDSVTVEHLLTREIADELSALGDKHGVKVGFWNTTTKYRTDDIKNLCAWPFERGVVTSDNRTVPCCTIGNPDQYEIGAKSDKSFKTLWDGDEYVKFRQAHLDGDIPAVCKQCYDLS